MANDRTKTQALKALGEKVTGQKLKGDETIVGVIDEITQKYEGGGADSGSIAFSLEDYQIVDTGGTITNATDIATLDGIIEKARAGKSTPYFFNKRAVVADKVYMMMSVVQQIVVNDEEGSYISCMHTEDGSAEIEISMQVFVKEGNTWKVSTTYHTINDSQ